MIIRKHKSPVGTGPLAWIFLGLCAGFSAQSAHAETALESTLRRQLDRLFYTEQYFLDVSTSSGPGVISDPLPGLAILDGSEPVQDILLVIDHSISRERVRIAEEMINRQLESEGLKGQAKLTVRQDTMMKVPPPELAPLGPRSAASETKPQDPLAPSDEAKVQPNIYDFIEGKRDLATKVFVVVWSAIASLLALYALIGRSGKSKTTTKVEHAGDGSAPAQGATAPAAAPGATLASKALTKDEIYSKDMALHKLAQELVEDASRSPEKIAGVITRWLEASDENVRYAAVFLKNCDMRTIEQVCRHLHPTDAEIIVSRDLSDFDPFGEENRKVLGQMRGEVARLAARHSIKVKPTPLHFLRQLSDDDLARVLLGEGPNDVALVATQVPVHRLTKYFEKIDERDCKRILDLVVAMDDVKSEDFEPIKARLEKRMHSLSDVLVDASSRVTTARQMLAAVGHAARQMHLAEELLTTHPETFQVVRRQITLAADVAWLPARAAKIFFQSVDGDLLSAAISDAGIDQDAMMNVMPEAVREAYVRGTTRDRDASERISAWRSVQNAIESLVSSGLISNAELAQAKAKADDALKRQREPSPVALGGAA